MEQIDRLLQQIEACAKSCGRDPKEIKLLAVSKGQSVEAIKAVYDAGIRDFGESRVQELNTKKALLPHDIRWHFIGSLQTNKAAKVAGSVALIHSVDSYRLAEKLSNLGVPCDILLQVNCSGEATKHGFQPHELLNEFKRIIELPNIAVVGLMTMGPRLVDEAQSCFHRCQELKTTLEKAYHTTLTHLSMGMSQDFQFAIQEGATILRIGSSIFN